MYGLSLTTLRDRWALFVGAIVTVSIGVALVQASLLTLVAAATADIPSGLSATEDLLVSNGYAGAVALMGIVLGISTFVASFIVGSTFAFTVAQRRRDFAQLRLIGASRRQVRRLLFGEAVLLGTIGTALGVVLGLRVADLEARLLVELDFVPAGFAVGWRPWILAVSAGVGIGIAVVGSLGAAYRAGRVRPLAAVRATGPAERVMTVARWLVGTIATGGAIAMMIVAPAVGSEGALALSMTVCMVWVVALAAFSPLIVPLVGRLLGLIGRLVLPLGRTGELTRANLCDGVRRSSSTAAPIMLMVGLVVGLSGAMEVLNAGSRIEAELVLDGDLVVTAAAPITDQLAAVPGVDVVSEEVVVVIGVNEEPDEGDSHVAELAVAIDPAAYLETHRLDDVEGDMAALTGDTVVLSRDLASSLGTAVGEPATLRFDGVDRILTVAATTKSTLAGPRVLLPLDGVATDGDTRRYILQMSAGSTPAEAVADIDAFPTELGVDVTAVGEWLDTNVDVEQRMNRNIMILIVGLAGLYSAVALVNAVVIAAADRREEFAVARLTGLSRAQVVRSVLWESLTVATAGLLLGAAAAAGTLLGVIAAVSDIVGVRVALVPWSLFAVVSAVGVGLVAITSLWTTLHATRQPAIAVAGARQ